MTFSGGVKMEHGCEVRQYKVVWKTFQTTVGAERPWEPGKEGIF